VERADLRVVEKGARTDQEARSVEDLEVAVGDLLNRHIAVS
jgi:hypothetical protein